MSFFFFGSRDVHKGIPLQPETFFKNAVSTTGKYLKCFPIVF